ncbi:MAG: MBL fold metallo-hydrolase [Rhodomicrobium sp.]|nr:MBL fold metallo-hydrolase [Rhodomicrobium sp.]
MKLTIIGCSDAFSSGGSYHSCYLLDTSKGRLLLDCGANSPLALKRAGIALSSIGAVVISHCHGDHFGGLPFLFLDKMFIERGPAPLEILGPPGIEARTAALIECLYPGIAAMPRSFDLVYSELKPGETTPWRGLPITAYEADHFSGSPSLALSFADDGRRFSFSGDSGWCEGVIEAGRGADLYLAECTTFSIKTKVHLDYLTLAAKFGEIGAKRYLLTHMSPEMLANLDKIDAENCIAAEDGLSIAI